MPSVARHPLLPVCVGVHGSADDDCVQYFADLLACSQAEFPQAYREGRFRYGCKVVEGGDAVVVDPYVELRARATFAPMSEPRIPVTSLDCIIDSLTHAGRVKGRETLPELRDLRREPIDAEEP